MIEKFKTACWFAQRPSFWPHALALVGRKLNNADRHERCRPEAAAWAADRAVTAEEALRRAGLFDPADGPFPSVPQELLAEAQDRARAAKVAMGGPADLDLLYASVILARPQCMVETGVAYGWSSLVILAAMERNGTGRLVSVDMPYVKRGNDPWVGIVVPEELRHRWTLIREPDRNGIDRAIAACGGTIDLAHYDSDKSYAGRSYGYPRLWKALRAGGTFISDDIQDNFGFRDFCAARQLPAQVTESGGKFVGLARRP
ncbi:MAG TPA: class I SAM-dependent methyltransferase [Sphingomicrobium sp.]|nr:class I SAM-dependent methyltransferase [Sphingomicrobium sp.]